MANDYKDFDKIDKNMAYLPANEDGIAWYRPFESPMVLEGFHWFEKYHLYHRLPEEKPAQVTAFTNGEKTIVPAEKCGAYNLSAHTAGGQVRFRTDSSTFQVKGALLNVGGMDHMAFTGSAGFDVYLKDNGAWRFFGVSRTNHNVLEFSATLCQGLKREMRDAIINFPLYNGVTSLAIGLDEDAKVEAPTPRRVKTPVVWYGTSIQQGGCATRPGMAGSNILSRMLDRQVINLGFSGSGKGEPEIADILADIDNAGLYLIDYTCNVDAKALAITLPNMLNTIRAKHPNVPIVLISSTPYISCMPQVQEHILENQIIRDETHSRVKAGDANLYYLDLMNGVLGDDFVEGSVDGAHLTDLGFLKVSEALVNFLKANQLY